MGKKVKALFVIKILIGALVICIGTALLLHNFGYLENVDIWDFWPLLFIL